MATASTGWYCGRSASVVSETNTTATIKVSCIWQNDGWTYDINNVSGWVYCNGSEQRVANAISVDTTSSTSASQTLGSYSFTVNKGKSTRSISCYAKITSNSSYVSGTKTSSTKSISVSAKPSYTVSYNANGGTGAPSNQTKWYGENITLSSSVPSRTGYTFAGWNTNSSGTGTNYASGATYSGNAVLTLYAKWTANTYAVSYNANGGTGAPSNQTKTYGVNLTLSSTKPTRTNYNFLGWSTSANGGVVYASGAKYTNNSAVTLYAVWELAYVKPRITNFNAYRCTSDGTASETGTYVKATFDWETDYEVVSMYIDWTVGIDWDNRVSEKVTASGTSGSVSQIVGSGNISTETTYSSRGWVKDSGGWTYSDPITIGTIKYPIDVKAGGTGVAIGKAAEKEAFEVNMDQYSYGDVYIERSEETEEAKFMAKRIDTGTEVWMGIGSGGVNHGVWSPGLNRWLIYSDGTATYIGNDTGTYKVGIAVNKDVKSLTAKTHSNHDTDKGLLPDISCLSYWNGAYNSSNSSNLTYCYQGTIQAKPTSLYNNTSGTTGTVTLSQTAANFNYLEIFFTDNNDYDRGSVRVYAPNGKQAALCLVEAGDDSTYIRRTRVSISGTSITIGNKGYIRYYSSKWDYVYGTNYIKIVRVVGYK